MKTRILTLGFFLLITQIGTIKAEGDISSIPFAERKIVSTADFSLFNQEITISYDLPAESDVKVVLVHESGLFMKVLDKGNKTTIHNEISIDKHKLPYGDYTYFIESDFGINSGFFSIAKPMASIRYVGLSRPEYENEGIIISYDLKFGSNIKLVVFSQDGEYMKTITNSYMEQGKYSISFDTKGLERGYYTYILETDYGFTFNSFVL